MKTDVRASNFVWVCVRRVNPKAYDLMGVWVDTPERTGEELAVSQCLDDTYYIGLFPINTAMPEKPVAWKGSYCPTRRTRELERRRLAREKQAKAEARRNKPSKAAPSSKKTKTAKR